VSYAPKLVLVTPLRAPERVAAFVEACLRDKVELIAVVGEGCEAVHDQIDDLIIGDGSDRARFIATTWHVGERVAEVMEFAATFDAKRAGGVQRVEL
jgi:hypothetical protein